MEIKCYYLGEFGFFNFSILGNVCDFINKNPKLIFSISTYNDYFKILKLLFPNNFNINKIINNHNDLNREKHNLTKKINLEGVDLTSFIIKQKNKKKFESVLEKYECKYGLRKLSKPIKINQIENDIIIKKPIISLCCRNRKLEPGRNLSKEDWKKIINTLQSKFNGTIIFHGLPEETYEFQNNFYTCKSIEESIYFLNRSFIFISSMCGFTQFASNCCCNILQIGTKKCWIEYNPFNKINRILEQENLDNLDKKLDEYFKIF